MCRLTMAPHLAPCRAVLAASRPVDYVGPGPGTSVAREGETLSGWCRGRYRAERQPSAVHRTTVCPEMPSSARHGHDRHETMTWPGDQGCPWPH